MTIDEMKANIQNGIAWLDGNRPGWRPKVKAKIEAGEFDMGYPCGCVIGATDGNFFNLFLITDNEWPDAIERGFSLPFMEYEYKADIEYAKLTQLWIEALQ